ncbi:MULTISPECIES: hypothetical protein [Streptomyces]|uniref:FAD-dependent oxidoreductase n=1 Tax=Streptomyces lienomycini TaxID=284035 RepID=A0ABV9WM57_9ACTN|nr:hypothetical protein [Streptomyces lienomycini]
MPLLEEPRESRTVALPPRPARHGGRCDVLVVGGGPAGSAAAVGAAGMCAALTVRHGRRPRGLPYRPVQRERLRQGARSRAVRPD